MSAATPVSVAPSPFGDVPAPPSRPRGVGALGTVLGVWAHPDDEAFLSAA